MRDIQERRTNVTTKHDQKYTLEPFVNVLVSVRSCRSDGRLFHAAGPE